MEKIGKAYNYLSEVFLKKTFLLWQYLGFHITRNYFESPIPDTRHISDEIWNNKTKLPGIDIDTKAMIDLIDLFSSKYKKEYDSFPKNKTSIPYQYYIKNGAFESVDAEIYYCMIRYFKPKRIFEIGSGNSTYLAAQAVNKNNEEFGLDTKLIAIEPYPNETLKKGFLGLSELRTSKLQDINLSEFNTLCENDILFIDSSHVLRIGSDVQYEYLELLPRLNKGVIIHIHDIFLPAEYKKNWILGDHRGFL